MERFWIAKLPSKLLNAPLASLAALARSLRSPHRGEVSFIFHCLFELVLIFKVVNISVDLSWSFMPTWLHVGLIFRLLGRLRASWGPLGAYCGALGRLLGALENSWVVLVGSSALWRAPDRLLGGSWTALGRILGALGRLLGALVRLLSALGPLLHALGRLLGAIGRLSEPLGARHHFVEPFFIHFAMDPKKT